MLVRRRVLAGRVLDLQMHTQTVYNTQSMWGTDIYALRIVIVVLQEMSNSISSAPDKQ